MKINEKLLSRVNSKQAIVTWSIVAACVTFFIFSVYFFYPGLMTFDSVFQYLQAKHYLVLSDWHPPILALVWRAGLYTTGKAGSMLVLQQFVFWVCIGGLAGYLYRRTKMIRWAITPFLIALLPFVYILTGIIWKDIHLALALLSATVLLLWIDQTTSRRVQTTLFIFAVLAILYALLVRHGSWGAALPLAFLAGVRYFSSLKLAIVCTVIILAVSEILPSIIDNTFHVEKNNMQATIMIDDIIATRSDDDIYASNLQPQTKAYFVLLRESCDPGYPEINRSLICGHPEPLSGIIKSDYNSIKNYWVASLVTHPFDYVTFRWIIFGRFINPNGITTGLNFQSMTNDTNNSPIPIRLPKQSSIDAAYTIEKQSISDFGFVYKPYFWIAIAITLLCVVVKMRAKLKNKLSIIVLIVSSLAYTGSYYFFAVSYDYRYTYWSAIAVIIASFLLIVELQQITKVSITHKKHPKLQRKAHQ